MSDRPDFDAIAQKAVRCVCDPQWAESYAAVAAALSNTYAAGVRQGRADMREEAANVLVINEFGNDMMVDAIRALPDTPA